ncbi:hypothetical protein FJZ40_01740 [Candidatus Shapirobacteria bacterium]|nr:hypothetical protein [Candidatus Shapirobacteria bacterium]
MSESRLPWYLSFALGVLFIFLSLLAAWLGVRNRLDTDQSFRDAFVSFSPGKPLTQTFTARHDFINIVILQFKNPGLANRGEFRFSLKSEEGVLLVERSFSGYNIGDPSLVRFQFDPIPASRGERFAIAVEAVSLNEPPIGVGIGRTGGLSFSAYYRTADKKAGLADLLNNLTQKLLGDKIFFALWALALFLLAGQGVKVIRRKL